MNCTRDRNICKNVTVMNQWENKQMRRRSDVNFLNPLVGNTSLVFLYLSLIAGKQLPRVIKVTRDNF